MALDYHETVFTMRMLVRDAIMTGVRIDPDKMYHEMHHEDFNDFCKSVEKYAVYVSHAMLAPRLEIDGIGVCPSSTIARGRIRFVTVHSEKKIPQLQFTDEVGR